MEGDVGNDQGFSPVLTPVIAIQLRDVTKRFGNVVANAGVNLRVERGTIHAVPLDTRMPRQINVTAELDVDFSREKMAMFGSLLAGVAHELNNPLSVVLGQIELLQHTASDPGVISRAERIRSATDRSSFSKTAFVTSRTRNPRRTDN